MLAAVATRVAASGSAHCEDGWMAAPVIEVERVSKRFGPTQALAEVDLVVASGTVLALLGPNGAGKTTLVRILTTLMAPDRGRATIAGCDVVGDAARVRPLIGLAGQYAAVDELLTGRENLELVGRPIPPEQGRASRTRAGGA